MRVVFALWQRNIKNFMRNRIQLAFTIIMPFFFLYVFSAVFKVENIENPVQYMLAGIIITNVFETSLTIATTTISDIVSGFMKEVLVSPVKRVQVAIGQLMSAATISTIQGIFVLIGGFFIGMRFESWVTVVVVVLVMLVVGIVFSGLGLLLATIVKDAQTFQVVHIALTMPLTFLCGAYIPLSMLPEALRYVAYCNPMTYTTAFFRTVLLEKTDLSTEQLVAEQLAFRVGDITITPWVSFGVVVLLGVLFLLLATNVFSKVDFSRISRTKAAEGDIWS